MSRRLLKADAVVLKTVKFGEIHKRVTLLTNTEGILYVNAYGASKGKSKLSGLVLPFSYLHVNIYHDPVKNGYKLTDAYPVRMHAEIHTNLKKYYAASTIAEVLLKSFGGGETVPFFTATVEILERIEQAEADKVVYCLIQFLWRFIMISGLAPDLYTCSRCGREAGRGTDVYIDVTHQEAYCSSCGGERMLALNRGGVQYLDRTAGMKLSAACRVTLDRTTLKQIYLFCKNYT